MILRVQGLIFCLLSFVLIVLHFIPFHMQETSLRLVLITIVVLLGIPHGALDTLLSKHLYKINTLQNWLIFIFLYLSLSFCVVLTWWLAPTIFLGGFLLLSAYHFSSDPYGNISWVFRGSYGASILVLPVLLYTKETQILFGFVSGVHAAQVVIQFLKIFSIPFLVIVLALILINLRKNFYSSLEFLFVVSIAIFTPPLAAFCVFFCGMHSPRHMIRTYQSLKNQSSLSFFKGILFPMVFVFVVFVISWLFVDKNKLDEGFIQILFIMLAALTVPHMIIIDKFQKISEA